LTERAKKLRDQNIKQLMDSIGKINHKIRREVLKCFVNKCRELYQIAFFQWRKKFPHPKFTKMDEIDELIEFRIEYTFQRYQACSDSGDSMHTDLSMIGDKEHGDDNEKEKLTIAGIQNKIKFKLGKKIKR
jgi:hypothetical protein